MATIKDILAVVQELEQIETRRAELSQRLMLLVGTSEVPAVASGAATISVQEISINKKTKKRSKTMRADCSKAKFFHAARTLNTALTGFSVHDVIAVMSNKDRVNVQAAHKICSNLATTGFFKRLGYGYYALTQKAFN